MQKAADIQEAIAEGANSFLYTEYKYMGVFGVIMSVLIFTLLGPPNFKPAVPGLRHPQSEGERSAGRLHPAYPTLLS